MLILEKHKTLGGTWSEERLYPGLRTNNMLGTYEYSDFPMETKIYGVKPGEHIPGYIVHEYLDAYATKFGIASKIRYQTEVKTAEQSSDGGWLLTTTNTTANASESPEQSQVYTRKLIIATGLTSQPSKAELPGMDQFDRPSFHTRDFRQHADVLKQTQTVAILGGNKSGWDAAYEFATAGVQVEWIIRESGHGPVLNAPPYVTPLKRWLEKLTNTRFLTWLAPCIWGAADGYGSIRRFFHSTAVGRFFVDSFWKILESDVLTLNGYDKHPETKKLKPWASPFWMGTTVGIMNYPTDFFELVRNGKIRIHIADVERVSEGEIHLSDKSSLHCDALIFATGWKVSHNVQFRPEGVEKRLGLPHQTNERNELAEAADTETYKNFPRLKDQPVWNSKYKPLPGDPAQQANLNEPYRLYRFLVPPDADFIKSHNIGFVGAMGTFSNVINAEIQGLWLTAYLDGKLTIDKSPEEIKWEATLHSQFEVRRHPFGYGHNHPDVIFEVMPYFDLMLSELGLKSHRKGGFLKEIFSPYGPEDYRGIVDEWKAKQLKTD